MNDSRGRHAFDPTAGRDDLEETPQIVAGRRRLRVGVLVLGPALAAMTVGRVVDSVWSATPGSLGYKLGLGVIFFCGTIGIQGARMIRNGRATLCDELKRQADERPS